MFGKKKTEDLPNKEDITSAEQKLQDYAFRYAVKLLKKDPQFRKALFAHYIGDVEFQPDDAVKKAISDAKAQAELKRAENARTEEELRRKVLDKIVSSPELTDQWVKAEIERQTAIGSPGTGIGDQRINPQRQSGGRYINPYRQLLDILDAAEEKEKISERQKSGGIAGKLDTRRSQVRGLRGLIDLTKCSEPAASSEDDKKPTKVEEQQIATAGGDEQAGIVTEPHVEPEDETRGTTPAPPTVDAE